MNTPLVESYRQYARDALKQVSCNREDLRYTAFWLKQVYLAITDHDNRWRAGVHLKADPRFSGWDGLLACIEEWTTGAYEDGPEEVQSRATKFRIEYNKKQKEKRGDTCPT